MHICISCCKLKLNWKSFIRMQTAIFHSETLFTLFAYSFLIHFVCECVSVWTISNCYTKYHTFVSLSVFYCYLFDKVLCESTTTECEQTKMIWNVFEENRTDCLVIIEMPSLTHTQVKAYAHKHALYSTSFHSIYSFVPALYIQPWSVRGL